MPRGKASRTKIFKNGHDLEGFLRRMIQDSLENEVAEKVKDEQIKQADEVVYAAYSPKEYDRRGSSSGGLKSRDSIVSNTSREKNQIILRVRNVATGADDMSGRGIAGLVEYGQGGGYGRYTWTPPNDRDASYLQPRPFIEGTRLSIANNRYHVKYLQKGLAARGVAATEDII